MCITEYIAYHCGHRSPSIVRPCPITTASTQFPPCTQQPTRQHNAATMCAACERTLHFRWVLIREWEHRWLHERGVCSCSVIFPGLLYQPRLSSPSANGAAPAGHPAFTPLQAGGASVRVPGLYAAEWVADHRALHEKGGCKCKLDMAVIEEPQVREEEMGAQEVAVLAAYRGVEHPSVYDEVGGEAERVAEIARLFGDVFLPTPMTVPERFVPAVKRGGRRWRGGRRTSFWLRDTQRSETDRRVVYGSGPYWNVGFEYHDEAGADIAGGAGKGKGKEIVSGGKPLCGLPLGCGPENIDGHHHVGEWERCKLFGTGTSIGRLSVDANEFVPAGTQVSAVG